MPTALLLLLLAAAAPPPAAEATALAGQKAWDELYLKFSAARPEQYPAEERKAVAEALLRAARGLEADAPLALSLAERSAAFHESAEAWGLAGELALKLDQNEAAAAALEKAVVLAPADDRLKLLRADLAFKEGDLVLAESLYAAVPAASAQHAAAQAGLEKTRQAVAERNRNLAELHRAEQDLAKRRETVEAKLRGLPVTLFEACRSHTRATCEALKRCHPQLASAVDCDELAGACPQSEKVAPFSREELGGCVAAIGRVGCEKVTPENFADPSAAVPECRILKSIVGASDEEGDAPSDGPAGN